MTWFKTLHAYSIATSATCNYLLLQAKQLRLKAKNVYEVSPGHDKSALTFVGTFSADGRVVKPTIIHSYVKIPRDIKNSVPDGITPAKTESGWMNSQAFFWIHC